jgi:hypothetical protein
MFLNSIISFLEKAKNFPFTAAKEKISSPQLLAKRGILGSSRFQRAPADFILPVPAIF